MKHISRHFGFRALALCVIGISPAGETAAATLYNTNYPTLQAAVDAAGSGDTVRITAADYYEQVLVVDKNLTLAGETGATLHAFSEMQSILQPYDSRFGLRPVVGTCRADVVLSGLNLDGERRGSDYSGSVAGIVFLGAGGTVTNCTVRGFRASPLRSTPWDYGFLAVNPVSTGFGHARVRVVGSTFEDNHFSMVLAGDVETPSLLHTSATIKGNRITGYGPSSVLGYGIWVRTGVEGEVSDNEVTDHIFTGNTVSYPAAICAYDNRVDIRPFFPLKPLRFSGNTLANNSGGILVVAGNGSRIENNKFLGAPPGGPNWGAVAASGTNMVIADNNLSGVLKGIWLLGVEYMGQGWPSSPPAANTILRDNWFCSVSQPVGSGWVEGNLNQEGTELCPVTPRFRSIALVPDGGLRATVRRWHEGPIILESSSGLSDWVPIKTNTGPLPLIEFEASPAPTGARQFFRVLSQ